MRTSKNRPKGASVVNNVEVTAERFLNMLRENVVPTIRRKMFWAKNVTVQMDGPAAHVGKGNLAAFDKLGKDSKTKITFLVQPAQSPDLNVLDLGIFNHLQIAVDKAKRSAVQWRIEDLAKQVRTTFSGMPASVLTSIFEKKSNVRDEVKKYRGDNTFTIPHQN